MNTTDKALRRFKLLMDLNKNPKNRGVEKPIVVAEINYNFTEQTINVKRLEEFGKER